MSGLGFRVGLGTNEKRGSQALGRCKPRSSYPTTERSTMKATGARRDRDGFKAVTDTRIEHTSGWVIEYREGHWRVTDAGQVVRGDFTSLNEAKGVALYYIDAEA